VITEGDDAPGFALPALVDGDHRQVALDDYVGDDIVILAFYPGDFNPACDAESDLDELDLFTMQKDVSVLGISADTLYSHAAFAGEYDLHVPLLADTRREVAARYGVTTEDDLGQALIERAVFVVDHDGVVQYAWSTDDLTELPNVDVIKDAIAETGGDDTAFARYRVGHAHYTEGRRAFTSAMQSYQSSEWMLSQSDFKRAQGEFEEAAEHFDSAVRFVDDADLETYYDHAEQKATALWQAAEWLTESASNYSSGAGAEGQRLRDDAERPLETARDLGEPVDPDDWPPNLDADEETESILPEQEAVDTELAVDIDAAAAGTADTEADDGSDGEPTANEDDDIDEADLEQLEAELAANQPEDPDGGEIEETPTSMVDAPPGVGDDGGGNDDGATANDGTVDDEIDDDDIEQLEAEMAASQSAAEAAQAEAEGEGDESDETPDDPDADLAGGAPDADADDLADERDVPPPGSGSLEPTGGGGSGGLEPEESDSSEPDEQDDPGGLESFDDVETTGENPFEGEDEPLDDPDGASDDDMDAIPEEDDLDEPDGATDEDMAAIPTEDELAGDEDDENDADADADDEPRY